MKIKSSELSKIISEEIARALQEGGGNAITALIGSWNYGGVGDSSNDSFHGVFSSKELAILSARKLVALSERGDAEGDLNLVFLYPIQMDELTTKIFANMSFEEINALWDDVNGWSDAVMDTDEEEEEEMGETLGLDYSNRGQQPPLTRAAGAPVVEASIRLNDGDYRDAMMWLSQGKSKSEGFK
ncbi:MAG TPA: hypothetical protein VMW36_06410 [Patescibacteria group bacterium]|nr:hypothetical protein [Patescibacteria group bacterium]